MPKLGAFRIIGLTSAAVSLLLLSTHVLGLNFGDVFQGTLDWLEDRVGKVFEPLDRLLKMAAAFFGIESPLAKHWHYAFVLIWLLAGSHARRFSQSGDSIFNWFWAGLCALVGGAATGFARLDSADIFAWPAAALMAFILGTMLYQDRRQAGADRSAAWIVLIIGSVIVAAGYYAPERPVEPVLGLEVQSPGLFVLAAFVFVIGTVMLVAGVFTSEAEGGPNNVATDYGFDIVATFGIASILAIIGLLLPG